MIDIEHLHEEDLDKLGKSYEKKRHDPNRTPQHLDELKFKAEQAAAVGELDDSGCPKN